MNTPSRTPKNILVGQSGGPTAVINASLYGVIAAGHELPEVGRVYGMLGGIEGFQKGGQIDLSEVLSKADLKRLKHTPAAYLGSCRYKLPEDLTAPAYPLIFKKFAEMNIGYFLYIGGNDSMDTVSKLSRYGNQIGSDVRIIGVPKTIDNDLILTDHTPGYGSACKYVATTVREICLDSSVYHNKSVTIVELMGRHAGWITAASVLARKYEGDNPVLIYLPEADFSMELFAADIEKALQKKKNIIVCVSEGISDPEGRFICEYGNHVGTDTFGHKMLTGCGKVLEEFVRERFQIKVRSVELNVSQRCSGMIASLADIEEAARAGYAGVEAAVAGETGKMISFYRLDQSDHYQINCRFVDVDEVCNQEKIFPVEWITSHGTDIHKDFLAYVMPLIQGTPEVEMKDGLPVYCYR